MVLLHSRSRGSHYMVLNLKKHLYEVRQADESCAKQCDHSIILQGDWTRLSCQVLYHWAIPFILLTLIYFSDRVWINLPGLASDHDLPTSFSSWVPWIIGVYHHTWLKVHSQWFTKCNTVGIIHKELLRSERWFLLQGAEVPLGSKATGLVSWKMSGG